MIFFVGIFAAYYIAKLPQILKGILDVILTLSLVLPPTVVGYLLLRVLGGRSRADPLSPFAGKSCCSSEKLDRFSGFCYNCVIQ